MRLLFAYQNTKANEEDFILTPAVFIVNSKGIKAYGFGLVFGWWAIAIAIGFNVHKSVPTFSNTTTR